MPSRNKPAGLSAASAKDADSGRDDRLVVVGFEDSKRRSWRGLSSMRKSARRMDLSPQKTMWEVGMKGKCSASHWYLAVKLEGTSMAAEAMKTS
jgi:hypothetical protein